MTVLAVGWVVTGLVIVVSGLAARRHPRALTVGLGATAFAMAGLGAVGNAVLTGTGYDYSASFGASYNATVRDGLGTAGSAMESLVVALLIAFQACAGLLILFGGRWLQVGLGAAIAFQLALPAVGWWYFLTSPLLVLGLALLWRAYRRDQDRPLYVPDILQAREHERGR